MCLYMFVCVSARTCVPQSLYRDQRTTFRSVFICLLHLRQSFSFWILPLLFLTALAKSSRKFSCLGLPSRCLCAGITEDCDGFRLLTWGTRTKLQYSDLSYECFLLQNHSWILIWQFIYRHLDLLWVSLLSIISLSVKSHCYVMYLATFDNILCILYEKL